MNSYGDEAITQQLLMRLRNARSGNMHGGGGYGSGSTKERAKLNPFFIYMGRYKSSGFTGTYTQWRDFYPLGPPNYHVKGSTQTTKTTKTKKKRKPYKTCKEEYLTYIDRKGINHRVCPTTARGQYLLKEQNPLYILSDKNRYVLRTGPSGKRAVKREARTQYINDDEAEEIRMDALRGERYY